MQMNMSNSYIPYRSSVRIQVLSGIVTEAPLGDECEGDPVSANSYVKAARVTGDEIITAITNVIEDISSAFTHIVA
jgi:hypothetical protein